MCKIMSRHSIPHWLVHLWSLLWCYYSKHMKYNVHETRNREINTSVFFKGTRGRYSGFITHFGLRMLCSVFWLWKHKPENHMEVKFPWEVWGKIGFLRLLVRVNFEVTQWTLYIQSHSSEKSQWFGPSPNLILEINAYEGMSRGILDCLGGWSE